MHLLLHCRVADFLSIRSSETFLRRRSCWRVFDLGNSENVVAGRICNGLKCASPISSFLPEGHPRCGEHDSAGESSGAHNLII